MPDFGFWAWGNPSNSIGPYDQVVKRIEMKEQQMIVSESKITKLAWRGKLSFAPKLRRGLLQAARNKPWGDVRELVWNKKNNFVIMEDHCKYTFIAHVEGQYPSLGYSIYGLSVLTRLIYKAAPFPPLSNTGKHVGRWLLHTKCSLYSTITTSCSLTVHNKTMLRLSVIFQICLKS